jgi:hypothetical protein
MIVCFGKQLRNRLFGKELRASSIRLNASSEGKSSIGGLVARKSRRVPHNSGFSLCFPQNGLIQRGGER